MLHGVARGLYNMTLGVAKSVEQMDLLSRQIGVSTEDLTRLQYAANQMANVSEQQFGMAMRRMTAADCGGSGRGWACGNAIRAIGLEARDLASMKPTNSSELADALRTPSIKARACAPRWRSSTPRACPW